MMTENDQGIGGRVRERIEEWCEARDVPLFVFAGRATLSADTMNNLEILDWAAYPDELARIAATLGCGVDDLTDEAEA